MADKTVAFSNRGGFWKTRYTFFSSCYAYVDRCFVSFNKFFRNNAVWKHNEESVNRTSFYGDIGGSGIAVTFNENPSQNKLYRAFSLESTNNVSGVTLFDVNNSSTADQVKRVEAGSLQERGGIMYGHIGRETVALGANTNIVGKIQSVEITNFIAVADPGFLQAVTAEYTLTFVDGGQNNLVYTQDFPSKLFMYYPEAVDLGLGLTTNYFYGYTLDPVASADFGSYNALGANMRPISMEGNVLTVQVNFASVDSYNAYADDPGFPDAVVAVDDDGVAQSNFYLYSMSAESINGEDPKGQTADAVITLGSNPYELYALNVEYSPTDLDHSK